MESPVEEGKVYKVKILGVAGNNEGVGNFENFPIYIKGAKQGDTVKIRVTKIHKYYATGESV